METKHTPGPWSVPLPIITDAGMPFSPVVANTLIAKVYSTCFGDHAQSEANARLMAAAPELLQVARGILVEDMLQYMPDEYVSKVRAAIFKATGEAL